MSQKKHALWLFYQLKRPSARKLLLYACASCRRIWDLLPDDRCRQAVEVLERFADGLAGANEVARAKEQFRVVLNRLNRERLEIAIPDDQDEGDEDHQPTAEELAQWAQYEQSLREAASPDMPYLAACAVNHALCKPSIERAANAGNCAAWAVAQGRIAAGKGSVRAAATEHRRSCDLVREIFANPSRPRRAEVGRLPPEVVSLAQGIYAGRAFDGMPALADALEEAGCGDVEVLEHCRGPAEHVRGCWALDLVLGRQ